MLLPIEDQESGIVEMDIELEESENFSFLIFEVIDISNEDLKEITQTDYDEEGEISMVLEDFPYDTNMYDFDENFKMTTSLRSSCVEHTLQLVVKDGFKNLEVSSGFHSSYSFFSFILLILSFHLLSSYSSRVKRQKRLNASAKSLVMYGNLYLIRRKCTSLFKFLPNKNATRWNSQYVMLSKLVEAFEKDPSLQGKLRSVQKHGKITAIEMKVLKEIISLLQPFQQATDELQGDYETVGGVIPAFLDIKTKLTQISDINVNSSFPSPIIYCKKFAESLRSSLVSRLSYV